MAFEREGETAQLWQSKNSSKHRPPAAEEAEEGAQERARCDRARARLLQQHDHHDHRPPGQHALLGDLGRLRLSRLAQEHAVRSAGGGREGRHRSSGARREERRSARRRPRPGARIGGARAQHLRPEDHEHRGRHADPAQRLPSAEEAPYEPSTKQVPKRNPMARYIGPKCKLARREGTDLFPEERRQADREQVQVHGAAGRHQGRARTRLSDYGLQLREKQKLRRMYGVLERQFRTTTRSARAHRLLG